MDHHHHDPTLLMDPIINTNHNHDQNNNNNNNNLILKRKRTKRQRPHSPISSFIIPTAVAGVSAAVVEEDDEELDMANCLILLATGACHNLRPDETKFTSKILLESPAAGKAGIYVYQCKTCYRTFPSFQALGGHRTSHKKTKINGPGFMELSDPDENEPTKFHPNPNTNTNNKMVSLGNKVHECSICRAEFTSGQALGGHMRRHRVMLSARPISQSPVIQADPSPTGSGPGPMLSLSLDLDLNLPAVSSSESEIVRRQQTALVLSTGPAPMVVGCHY